MNTNDFITEIKGNFDADWRGWTRTDAWGEPGIMDRAMLIELVKMYDRDAGPDEMDWSEEFTVYPNRLVNKMGEDEFEDVIEHTIANIYLMDYHVPGGVVLTNAEADKLADTAMIYLPDEPVRISDAEWTCDEHGYEIDDEYLPLQSAYNSLMAAFAVEKAAAELGFTRLPEHMSVNVTGRGCK